MKELLKESPVRTVITVGYLAFAAIYLAIGFLPASAEEPISGYLSIPSAQVASHVTPSHLENHNLYVPEAIVSAYQSTAHKTLLMAHSTSAFENLPATSIGDRIFYNDHTYRVIDRRTTAVEDINMAKILSDTPRNTLVLMTCAGNQTADGKYTHRLILTALQE